MWKRRSPDTVRIAENLDKTLLWLWFCCRKVTYDDETMAETLKRLKRQQLPLLSPFQKGDLFRWLFPEVDLWCGFSTAWPVGLLQYKKTGIIK